MVSIVYRSNITFYNITISLDFKEYCYLFTLLYKRLYNRRLITRNLSLINLQCSRPGLLTFSLKRKPRKGFLLWAWYNILYPNVFTRSLITIPPFVLFFSPSFIMISIRYWSVITSVIIFEKRFKYSTLYENDTIHFVSPQSL